MTTTERIEAQERQDRYVASRCLRKLLYKGKDLQINPTKITDYVDLNCSVINLNDKLIQFNVEIKERNKNEWQMKNYPQAELKVAKYKRMRQSTPEGTKLLYMVLLNNQKCLIFDMDTLDWSKVEQKDWMIKITQMDENSPYVSTPTYFIPYELAVASVDCSEYVEEYKTTISRDSLDTYVSTITQ
jgi:hypothetical protein